MVVLGFVVELHLKGFCTGTMKVFADFPEMATRLFWSCCTRTLQ